MERPKVKDRRERMESARTSSLSASEIRTVVRRIGFVAQKAHETMMSNLIAAGNDELAENLNDALKPAVDYLLHFEMEDGDVPEKV